MDSKIAWNKIEFKVVIHLSYVNRYIMAVTIIHLPNTGHSISFISFSFKCFSVLFLSTERTEHTKCMLYASTGLGFFQFHSIENENSINGYLFKVHLLMRYFYLFNLECASPWERSGRCNGITCSAQKLFQRRRKSDFTMLGRKYTFPIRWPVGLVKAPNGHSSEGHPQTVRGNNLNGWIYVIRL